MRCVVLQAAAAYAVTVYAGVSSTLRGKLPTGLLLLRGVQEAVAGGDKPAPRNCLIAGLCKLGDWIDDILWRKLYALTFAITVLTSVSVLRMKR
jgi:hypothetical protein